MASSYFSSGGTLNLKNITLRSSALHNHFNFMHINPGSLKPHLDEIRSLIADVDMHLLAVSETWFSDKINDNLVSIPGFHLIRHDRKHKRGGGVAIYLKSGIKFRILKMSNPNAKIEFLFVEIDNRSGSKLVVGVVYNPPPNTRIDSLLKILTDISAKYSDCLMLGDFNINLLSSSPTVTKFKRDLSLLNLLTTSSEPTNFVTGKRPSLIDLLIVKDPDKLARFSQIPLGSFSSHDVIYGSYAISMANLIENNIISFRNFKNINLLSLEHEASNLNWDDVYTLPNIDDKVALVTKLLFHLLEKFAPVRTYVVTEDSRPSWLNEQLVRLINVRNFFHLAASREKDPIVKNKLLESFRRMRNKVTTMKRNSKALEIRKKLNPLLPSSVLWKNIRNAGITKVTSSSDESFSPDEFNDFFFSVFSEPSAKNVTFDTGLINDGNFEFTAVSNEEVHIALQLIKTNALGDDGVPAIFLKKLCPFIIPFLTHIINSCITESYFPYAWKIAKVKPIPKLSNIKSVEDFRPISILPCMSKLLERVMKDQIQNHVDAKNLLFKHQSGFRNGHSTETAMLKVTHDIAQAIDKKHVTAMVFLDFKKAFDLVSHEKLLVKLFNKFEFSPRACNLIKSYLTDRRQCVIVAGNRSDVVPVTSGTPQGGILSALLFSLYINDLSEVVNSNLHLYADDSQMYCSDQDITRTVAKMNDCLTKVSSWAKINSVIINPSKSQAMIISSKTTLNAPPILLDSNVIPYCDKVKSLGVIVDPSFTWNQHVDKICSVTNGALCMLRQSQNIVPLSTRVLLVKALLLPKLLYCSNIFMGCSKSAINKIAIVFNSCIRYIYRIRKFESVALHRNNLLGCSIEKFFQVRACIFMFKLLRVKSPTYLYENLVFPRYRRNNLLGFPAQQKSNQFRKSFFVLGVRFWNSLSSEIRNVESLPVFKAECLSYLASQKS